MFEQFWDQRLRKFVLIDNDEGVTTIGPSYQICISGFIEETRCSMGQLELGCKIRETYLLNFCTKGGICFRFACVSLLAIIALCSRSSPLFIHASSFACFMPSSAANGHVSFAALL